MRILAKCDPRLLEGEHVSTRRGSRRFWLAVSVNPRAASLRRPCQGPHETQAVASKLVHAPEERQDVSDKVGNRDHASRIARLAAESKVGVSPVLTKGTEFFAPTARNATGTGLSPQGT